MISCYDLEDNLIAIFESYKECANWFNTSVKCIHSHICRSKKGMLDRKFNKEDHKWYRLYKIEDDNNE